MASNGGVIHIRYGTYSSRWNNANVRLAYVDPNTGEQLVYDGSFRRDEILTIVLQHEMGHAAHAGASERS